MSLITLPKFAILRIIKNLSEYFASRRPFSRRGQGQNLKPGTIKDWDPAVCLQEVPVGRASRVTLRDLVTVGGTGSAYGYRK